MDHLDLPEIELPADPELPPFPEPESSETATAADPELPSLPNVAVSGPADAELPSMPVELPPTSEPASFSLSPPSQAPAPDHQIASLQPLGLPDLELPASPPDLPAVELPEMAAHEMYWPSQENGFPGLTATSDVEPTGELPEMEIAALEASGELPAKEIEANFRELEAENASMDWSLPEGEAGGASEDVEASGDDPSLEILTQVARGLDKLVEQTAPRQETLGARQPTQLSSLFPRQF